MWSRKPLHAAGRFQDEMRCLPKSLPISPSQPCMRALTHSRVALRAGRLQHCAHFELHPVPCRSWADAGHGQPRAEGLHNMDVGGNEAAVQVRQCVYLPSAPGCSDDQPHFCASTLVLAGRSGWYLKPRATLTSGLNSSCMSSASKADLNMGLPGGNWRHRACSVRACRAGNHS